MKEIAFEVTQEDINTTELVWPRSNGCAVFVALKRKIPSLTALSQNHIFLGDEEQYERVVVPNTLQNFIETADTRHYWLTGTDKRRKTLPQKPQPATFTIYIPDNVPTVA